MQTATKERPILFSAPMVRAILAGHKTQTRRVVKPQPPCECAYVINANKSHALCFQEASAVDGTWTKDTVLVPPTPRSKDHRLPCPYGQPGDRLWVKESIILMDIWNNGRDDVCVSHYVADLKATSANRWPWKRSVLPSIHCPWAMSRIDLEVVNVRVERVQDISEADAEAEGCERLDIEREEFDDAVCPQCGGTRLYTAFHPESLGAMPDTDCRMCDTYVKRYRHLWDSIHGPGSWSDNPWVWVVEFKRVDEKSAMQGQTESGASETSVK